MSDARRERQLGIITPNMQRYEASAAEGWLDAVKRQVCPFCGAGPFVVVAHHVARIHHIHTRELREMLGVAQDASICDETFSRVRSDLSKSLGLRPTGPNPNPIHVDGPGPWCGTASGYAKHRCRCDACTATQQRRWKKWRSQTSDADYKRRNAEYRQRRRTATTP